MAGGMDMSGLLRGLGEGRRRMLAEVVTSVDVFAEHVVGDAQQLAPVDTGALKASGTTLPAEVHGERVRKEVGFNTEYAAAVHEDLDAQHDQGQAKYLTAALQANAPKLGPFVQGRLKGAGF